MTTPDQILESLTWRYATKMFDPAKTIPAEDWDALEESLVLTPSSFGLQPWEFVVVQDAAVREQLVEHSWGQRQVADASHLLVIALRSAVDEAWVDRFLARTEELRGKTEGLSGYRDVIVGFLSGLDAGGRKQWAKLQAYIALGQFMTCASMLRIDTCPMEGFIPEKYDEILGLAERGLSAAVLCPAGYRTSDDKYASLPKVRFKRSEMVSEI